MSLLGKDQNGNITKLAGHLTQRVNARWFPCARKVEDGVEYYDLPIEVEEYYKPFSSYLIYSLGFMEPNTTKTPKLRYADKVLDLYDITNEDGLVNVGQLCGVYQAFTKNVLNDTHMYFCGSSHRDAYYQLPDDIMDRLLPAVNNVSAVYSETFAEAQTLSTETTLIDDGMGSDVRVMASASTPVTIDANNKTYDGVKYTHRLKFGGSVNISQNSLKFNNKGKTGIIIYCMSSSSSAARTLKVLNASGANYAISATYEGDTDGTDVGGAQITKVSFELPEGTFYFGSASGGLNIYGITVDYSAAAGGGAKALIYNGDKPAYEKVTKDVLDTEVTDKLLPNGTNNTVLTYVDGHPVYAKVDYNKLAEAVVNRLLPDATTGSAGQAVVLGADGKPIYKTISSGGGGTGSLTKEGLMSLLASIKSPYPIELFCQELQEYASNQPHMRIGSKTDLKIGTISNGQNLDETANANGVIFDFNGYQLDIIKYENGSARRFLQTTKDGEFRIDVDQINGIKPNPINKVGHLKGYFMYYRGYQNTSYSSDRVSVSVYWYTPVLNNNPGGRLSNLRVPENFTPATGFIDYRPIIAMKQVSWDGHPCIEFVTQDGSMTLHYTIRTDNANDELEDANMLSI